MSRTSRSPSSRRPPMLLSDASALTAPRSIARHNAQRDIRVCSSVSQDALPSSYEELRAASHGCRARQDYVSCLVCLSATVRRASVGRSSKAQSRESRSAGMEPEPSLLFHRIRTVLPLPLGTREQTPASLWPRIVHLEGTLAARCSPRLGMRRIGNSSLTCRHNRRTLGTPLLVSPNSVIAHTIASARSGEFPGPS